MHQQTAYADEAVTAAMTRLLVDAGHPILQSHRLAPTDRDHVRALLALFDPPPNAAVLDIGCGVGAVAAHMAALRPDLAFTLLNLSPAQLALAPQFSPPRQAKLTPPSSAPGGGLNCPPQAVAAHMHALPFPDSCFDAAMFNFSLGHGDLVKSLGEAARAVRSGGAVFLWELTAELPDAVMAILGYRPHRLDEILRGAYRAGLKAGSVHCPLTSTADAQALLGDAWTERGFDRCWAVAVRLTVSP